MNILFREPRMVGRGKNNLLNQTSEHQIGTFLEDNVTGAPVIELGYKQR